MAHTRGGGIGNMAGSDDRSLEELIAELRQRCIDGRNGWKEPGYADVSSDELERLFDFIEDAVGVFPHLVRRAS